MDELRGIWRGITTPKRNGEEFDRIFDRIWVKGDLIHSGDVYYIHPVANAVKVQGELGRLIVMHEVDTSTLCECTGLRDKNGKPIFEGDIIKAVSSNTPNCFVEFREGIFYVKSQIFVYKTLWRFLRDYECEIISNIHDNPELLKGGTMKWKV